MDVSAEIVKARGERVASEAVRASGDVCRVVSELVDELTIAQSRVESLRRRVGVLEARPVGDVEELKGELAAAREEAVAWRDMWRSAVSMLAADEERVNKFMDTVLDLVYGEGV